ELPMRHIIMEGTDERFAINGRKYKLGRMEVTYTKDQCYVWRVVKQKDDINSMLDAVHSHGMQFRIFARNCKLPVQNEICNKDTFIVNEGEYVDMLVKFSNTGMFMYHCHNLEHQEHGMMAHFEVESD